MPDVNNGDEFYIEANSSGSDWDDWATREL